MKLVALAVIGLAAVTPAMAQSQYPYDEPYTSRSEQGSGALMAEPESPVGEQQAQLPEEPTQKRHPGTVLKLRGGFSSAPVVEGDEYPENSVGLREPKQQQR